MRILVSAASKHGATTEIAEAVGDELAERGHQIDVIPPEKVTSTDDRDAFVLGSAVYMGRWMPEARHLAERLGPTVGARPVWLFSSGPIGDPAMPTEDPVDAAAIIEATGARDHRVFAGKLDKARLSVPERAVVRALKVQEGDFRDWDAIKVWAASIAESLRDAAE